MAATGGEAASADHIGSESLWIPRAGRPEEEEREEEKECRKKKRALHQGQPKWR